MVLLVITQICAHSNVNKAVAQWNWKVHRDWPLTWRASQISRFYPLTIISKFGFYFLLHVGDLTFVYFFCIILFLQPQ